MSKLTANANQQRDRKSQIDKLSNGGPMAGAHGLHTTIPTLQKQTAKKAHGTKVEQCTTPNGQWEKKQQNQHTRCLLEYRPPPL